MIVHDDPQQPPGLGDAVGHLDIGAAGFGRAGGVIVDEDDCACAKVQRPADHLTRVDRGFIDRAFALNFVGNQAVAGIEKQHTDPLDGQVRHVDGQVIDQRLP